LLDYGLVGRLVDADRNNIAKEEGYKAIWMKKNRPLLGSSEIVGVNILHQLATSHFDRVDLSPVTLENAKNK